VFLNLLVNAAQAMPDGRSAENQIVVSTRASAGQVTIEISDSGAGIPPEVLPRIFDVFFTTKPIGVGTGLGLSICHRIVSAMGGAISIDSRVGAGTTVRVSLPAVSVGFVKAASDAPSAAHGSRRRGAVLIVEDEHAVARMLQKVLSSTDAVTLASSGVEALSRLESQQAFDVILCDLMMPEMTGMDFYRAVVSKSEALARRIVFMTGGAFTPSARTFLDQVENLRLDKPVDLKLLRQLVHSAVVENDPAR
jgi:CheY-like chemotaxis protein